MTNNLISRSLCLVGLLCCLLCLSCQSKQKKQHKNTATSFKPKRNVRTDASPPWQVVKLMESYPEIVIGYRNGNLLFSDSSAIHFDDLKTKTNQELLNGADIEDMFSEKYSRDSTLTFPINDAGRIRNEAFFMSVYGSTMEKVRSNLMEIVWCPKLVNQRILVNKRNGVAAHFIALSKELDEHPEFKKYLTQIGGTFNFRKISGTNRLSMHSFGITIDINISHSNYWQWDCGCVDEEGVKGYKNRIPMALVQIFEKHGFIWGGRWKHYDTMHFEYRPELLR